MQKTLNRMMKTDPDQVLEAEFVMDQWRNHVPDGHIHSTVGSRYAVLARRIPCSRRMLVAMWDRHENTIYAAGLKSGRVEALVQPAFSLIPASAGKAKANHVWKG